MQERMKRLLNNEDFVFLFLENFLKKDIERIVLYDVLDNNDVITELKARQIFKQFIDNCLNYDKINEKEETDG